MIHSNFLPGNESWQSALSSEILNIISQYLVRNVLLYYAFTKNTKASIEKNNKLMKSGKKVILIILNYITKTTIGKKIILYNFTNISFIFKYVLLVSLHCYKYCFINNTADSEGHLDSIASFDVI